MATAPAKTLNDYFVDWLGAKAGSEQEIVRLVERGLPIRVLNRLQQRGLSRNEIASVIIPPRTLKHRRSRHEPLSRSVTSVAVWISAPRASPLSKTPVTRVRPITVPCVGSSR